MDCIYNRSVTNSIRAARRLNSEAAINLTARRIWYAETEAGDPPAGGNTPPDPGTPPPAKTNTADQDLVPLSVADGLDALPASWQEEIRKLRSENAERRRKLQQIEADARKRERDLLTEQGNYKALYEQVSGELEAHKPKAEQYEDMRAFVEELVSGRVKALPEPLRKLVPGYDNPLQTLRWLESNAEFLTPRNAPNLDPGARGTGGAVNTAGLTADELAEAQRMGVKPETYAKAKLSKSM